MDPEPSPTLSAPPRKGWHARGYLPHCDFPGLIQGLTIRLHDSVPAAVLEGWKRELTWMEQRNTPEQDATYDFATSGTASPGGGF